MRTKFPPNDASRAACSDSIERFLDRSWLLERIPLETIRGHRCALQLLDKWMQRQRDVTLAAATPSDMRALLKSSHWDAASRQSEALLGLIMRFFQSLRDCKLRADDPFESLIEQELAIAATARNTVRLPSREMRPQGMVFSRSSVL